MRRMIAKRWLALVVLAAMLASAFPAVSAPSTLASAPSLVINEYTLPLPHPLIEENGHTLIAAYDICTPLFADISYSADKSVCTITKTTHLLTAVFRAGEKQATVNGEMVDMEIAPRIVGEEFYIPLRFFNDCLEYITEWNAEENKIEIFTYDKEVVQAMDKFREYVTRDELWDFFLRQYDPDQGGFYYATSSRDYPQFGVNLESTSQALVFLNSSKVQGVYQDLADVLPENFKKSLIEATLACQDPDDGYFYNDWQGKNIPAAKRERDLTAAKNILRLCGGAEPLYPLPEERIKAAQSGAETAAAGSGNDYLLSEEAFIAWLDSRDWSDSYSTGHLIASSWNMIRAAGMAQVCADYLTKKQNPETGMWEDGFTYHAVDGVMKIGAFYNSTGIPFPNMDKTLDSIIKTLMSDEQPSTICEVWNPIEAINYIISSNQYKIPDEMYRTIKESILKIMDLTYENMQKFKEPDGGISYQVGQTQSRTHGASSSLGLAEGDMDATLIGTYQIRRSFYSIMKNSFVPPSMDHCRDEIMERLKNAPSVEKVEVPTGFSFDFEDCEPGNTLPSGVSKNTVKGTVTIAESPLDPANTAIKITTEAGGATQCSFAPYFQEDVKDITLECDLMVTSLTAGSNFYNTIQVKEGVQWCLSSTDGKTFHLSYRVNESGVGTVIKAGLPMNRWHRIKIRYQPGGIDGTVVTYYYGDQIIERTRDYYGIDVGNPPATRVDTVSFNAFSSAVGTIYLDNVKMYENE